MAYPLPPFPLLAKTSPPSGGAFGGLLPWIGLLLALVLVGAVVIAIARRSLRGDGGGAAGGFTLHDLRELHRRGELNDEEFGRAKEAMIGRLTARDAPDGVESDVPKRPGNAGADGD